MKGLPALIACREEGKTPFRKGWSCLISSHFIQGGPGNFHELQHPRASHQLLGTARCGFLRRCKEDRWCLHSSCVLLQGQVACNILNQPTIGLSKQQSSSDLSYKQKYPHSPGILWTMCHVQACVNNAPGKTP